MYPTFNFTNYVGSKFEDLTKFPYPLIQDETGRFCEDDSTNQNVAKDRPTILAQDCLPFVGII